MGTETKVLRSTIKWAEREVWRAVRDSELSPVIAVEEFIKTMDDYSTRNLATSMIFSIAKDVGQNILDEMLLERRRR
jgi:hypothetical protein